MKCAICGQPYAPGNIRVLGHREDLWFLGVLCSSCGSQGLVAALVKESKVPSLISDLSPEEQSQFVAGGPVDAEDVLEMHYFLEDFSGDFAALFSTK